MYQALIPCQVKGHFVQCNPPPGKLPVINHTRRSSLVTWSMGPTRFGPRLHNAPPRTASTIIPLSKRLAWLVTFRANFVGLRRLYTCRRSMRQAVLSLGRYILERSSLRRTPVNYSSQHIRPYRYHTQVMDSFNTVEVFAAGEPPKDGDSVYPKGLGHGAPAAVCIIA